ncbi:DUF2367 domain containing protein [Asbolus verrucosus]|uniref:Membrane protein BRI3 n=1 Tax=Asbolus verrucosus TaxID=1661398 RepID=A0A482W1C5_ASBVE|nr:DUF2367 domain containing protein [Asbolus verrucosus]
MNKEPPPPYSAAPYPGVHQQHYNCPPAAPIIHQYTPCPSYGATQTTIIVPETEVIIVGACPACRIGVLEDDFTCLGLLCAILFFPAGILCCLLLKEKRCGNCGARFG